MKIKFILCLIVSLLLGLSLFSQEAPIPESQQIAIVSKIIKNSSSAKMDQVWPGYNLSSKPIFITFDNGHIYAFNMKFNEGEWQRRNIDGVEVLYTNKDHWGITTSPMQFHFEINGQEAFVFRLDLMPEPAFLPFFVFVHERFHVHQIQYFESEQDDSMENSYPESEDSTNLALMQLEEQILLDFMKALNAHSNDEAIVHLKTFISVNKQRRKLLSPSSLAWEARQQMVEGLADYTAAKNLDVFGYFGENRGQKHILNIMDRYTTNDDITERALKWRHYGVGASIGYALDFLQVTNWKKDVERNISLQTLLENRLSLSSQEEESLYQQALIFYSFPRLQNEIKNKIDSYSSMIRSYKEGFKNLSGIVVHIQNPPDSGISAGGHSRGVYSLADGTMLSVEDTSKTSSADNRWILEMRSMPYLFQTNDGFRRFKTSKEDLEIMIDGKFYALHQIREKPFSHLTLKSKSCSFKSSHNQGTISIRDGDLHIQYF